MKTNNKGRPAARADVVRQLKETRKELHLTQEVLAERAGTKKSNISRLESGDYNPSLDFLVKVAGCMGKKLQITVTDDVTGIF
ncbi:MAG: helix-turn-helix transcriptional regulator [Lachnospiraceae bacterium]|nr:helix-turn-helix transcriptional regulator [Lachnospiraceae bacterium]